MNAVNASADLETLWREHRAALLRYMRRRVDVQRAEDLVQDVYLSALDAIQRGCGYTDSVRGWLFRIAHNLVIDNYRNRDREKARAGVELDALFADEEGDSKAPAQRSEVVADGCLTPHELAEQAEVAALIHGAIALLSDEQAVVIKRRLEGYEFAEISTELGKSEGATKALQYRAYANLHTTLHAAMGYEERIRQVPKTNFAGEIRLLLCARGPLSVAEMMCAARLTRNQVAHALRCGDFVRVDYRKSRQGEPMAIWGVAGIHDRKAA